MEITNTKGRTPSRCREWERKRRNKFNDAIARLGEVVKEINKAIDSTSKDSDSVQYPKVEIIEKAIICLTTCAQEKTQLKAEILALQVKLDADKKEIDKKDASTQVFIGINKKKPNGKYVKVLMLQKSKRNTLKEKTIQPAKLPQNKPPQNLRMLLPKTSLTDKKGAENTIVVLPAAPYIFPQRPLLLPTVPPAFVLVDPNLQPLNKQAFPLINRNNGDITKTTMVNILPISAYSRPLSATKSKRSAVKTKINIPKKIVKKSRQTAKSKECGVKSDTSKEKISSETVNKQTGAICVDDKENSQVNEKCESVKIANVIMPKGDVASKSSGETTDKNKVKHTNLVESTKLKGKDAEIPIIANQQKITKIVPIEKEITSSNSNANKNSNPSGDGSNKPDKSTSQKQADDKDKENKLPNILDTALCENAVDGGNARLELAEEFLAASPTAAFLMSFPLVSGNRADSPAEDTANTIQVTSKYSDQRRNDITTPSLPYFEKTNDNKSKSVDKSHNLSTNINKHTNHNKYLDNAINKHVGDKSSIVTTTTTINVSSENPFLNLPMPSFIPATTVADSGYGLDFDCNINKSIPTQSTSYPSSSNFFYKSDPFSTVKSTIYSTSNISSGHEFNSFGLYPCAMEKYASKNKSEYPNVEDNLMKIGSSRLTYDIDLGWSHKSFDFVSCTSATNTLNKDNLITTAAGPYSTSYNPFNPEFHVPLTSNTKKKENSSTKPSTSFAETLTNFYSQPTNLWSEDVPFYSNSNIPKTLPSKNQNYLPLEHMETNLKPNISKQYEAKHMPETVVDNTVKSSNITQQLSDKYTKKSPSKMHINWMTSEIRPMQNVCNPSQSQLKEAHKTTFNQLDHTAKKQNISESNNYFPISMHNYPPQATQEELQVWPPTRPAGTTEISIEPPPINLPTLVGDLALGPHDRKKNMDITNRGVTQSDIQLCSNFFSVTQLMNRSTDTMPSRYQEPNIEPSKSTHMKHNISNSTNDSNRKIMSRLESHVPQPCYVFNDPKPTNSYDVMGQFSQSKSKTNKADKPPKAQKNSYSAEALIRGGSCSQKVPDSNNTKFMTPSQKYNDYNTTQDSSVAQVSHFPPILDYSDNGYTGQQFSGTTLYNSTTNTMSNSFYSNFMPGSSNLMSSNYTSGPFSSDFIDYNQSTECNYSNHKYEELKMRNNSTIFQQDKLPSNYKSSRRESASKHKLECSKKDSSKKYSNKRTKLNTDVEDWTDTSHLLWQNKAPAKRHTNLISEELSFPNYVGNQMPAQYQPDFFNSHLMPSNVQSVGHNVDRSLTSFPATSRANFNLSTIFPEITMKVQ